jgi:hypothetical protein
MNDRPDDPRNFLRRLIAMLGKQASVEAFEVGPNGKLTRIGGEDADVNQLIHMKVDMDLLKAFDQWLGSQEVPRKIALSTFAYWIGHEVYETTQDENEACVISLDFGNYMHSVVHALYKEHGHPRGKKKPDVEK